MSPLPRVARLGPRCSLLRRCRRSIGRRSRCIGDDRDIDGCARWCGGAGGAVAGGLELPTKRIKLPQHVIHTPKLFIETLPMMLERSCREHVLNAPVDVPGEAQRDGEGHSVADELILVQQTLWGI